MPDSIFTNFSSDKGFCAVTGRFESPKEEQSNWLSQAVSDAYEYFVPPSKERPFDLGGFWEIQDDLKAHCREPIQLTLGQCRAAKNMADQLSLTGRFSASSDADKEALKQALASGNMEDFTRVVNVELTHRGSDYRLTSTEFTERMSYASEVGDKAHLAPIEKENPRSILLVTDLVSGGINDKQVIVFDQAIAGYGKPKVSPSL